MLHTESKRKLPVNKFLFTMMMRVALLYPFAYVINVPIKEIEPYERS